MDTTKDWIRVTELLKPWSKFEGIPEDVLANKAQIGTNVHEAINMHSIGLPVPKLTAREERYFESYKIWEETYRPIYMATEQRLYDHDLTLTGCIDGIIAGDDGKGRIIDFKCSAMPLESHWKIQLGWYYLLCKKNEIEVSRNVRVLQLTDKGGMATSFPFEITDSLIGLCQKFYDTYIYMFPIKKHDIHEKKEWCC